MGGLRGGKKGGKGRDGKRGETWEGEDCEGR